MAIYSVASNEEMEDKGNEEMEYKGKENKDDADKMLTEID